MARRTGIPSLLETARILCLLVTKFSPTIIRLYPNNAALLAALAAANTACSVLSAELAPLRDLGT